MIAELIFLLLELTIYLFILASPLILLIIIIRYIIKKYKNRRDLTQKKDINPGPYRTGWNWNEQTQLWEPPGYKAPEVKVDRSGPTYEEWKAAKEQGKGSEQKKAESSEYRFTSPQLSKDDTIIYKQIRQQTTYQTQEQPKTPPKPKPNPTQTVPQYRTYDQPFWEAEQRKNTQPIYKENKVKYPRTEPKPVQQPIQKPIPNAQTAEYQDAYEAVNILTRNESENYKKLKIAADRKGYIICPKVRLADIVKPRNDPRYMSRFGKIKSKHVDFVIYDGDMRHLKAIIELDDRSHDRKDRQERDEFVDFILNDCGYRVIHTRYITPDILDDV